MNEIGEWLDGLLNGGGGGWMGERQQGWRLQRVNEELISVGCPPSRRGTCMRKGAHDTGSNAM